MSDTQALQRQIAQLPALDRIALVEDILQGLDAPDKSLDALWASEAETRLAAYKTGQVKAIPAAAKLNNNLTVMEHATWHKLQKLSQVA